MEVDNSDSTPRCKLCRILGPVCFGCNKDVDLRYLDVFCRHFMGKQCYTHENTRENWLRVTFQSKNNVDSVRADVSALIQENAFDTVEHLFLGTTECLVNTGRSIKNASFPISHLGKILERCNPRLETFRIERLLLVGTASEFEQAIEQMSRCKSLVEFASRKCTFLHCDDDWKHHKWFHQCWFRGISKAVNAIESLEKIVIDNCNDAQELGNEFASALVWNRNKKKNKKAIRLLELDNCFLSNRLIHAMFGEDSRVEQLVLNRMDQQLLPVVTKLLRAGNRTLQRLELSSGPHLAPHNLHDDSANFTPIPSVLGMLEALRENHVLKHLKLRVDCKIGCLITDSRSLNGATADAFIKAIGNLACLEVLAFDFKILDHPSLWARESRVNWESLDWESRYNHLKASHETSLKHISRILGNGLARSKTVKAIDVRVYGMGPMLRMQKRYNLEDSAIFPTWISKEVNDSLLFALFRSSPRSSSTTISTTECVLQEFSFVVLADDAPVTVRANRETSFWMALNKAGIPKLLRRPDDFVPWRDIIIENRGDPSIVYHALRQKCSLVSKSVRRPPAIAGEDRPSNPHTEKPINLLQMVGPVPDPDLSRYPDDETGFELALRESHIHSLYTTAVNSIHSSPERFWKNPCAICNEPGHTFEHCIALNDYAYLKLHHIQICLHMDKLRLKK